MFEKLRKSIADFIKPIRNSMSLPQQFLRYGNAGRMLPDWTQVMMNDSELYTGYGYAAITNRANKVASIATEDLRTDSKKEDFTHPYLEIISKSPTFSDYDFWKTISTYLDLEGVFYLMAIRAVTTGTDGEANRVGKIQEFKLLNPYNITRILSPDGLTVKGYQENKKGMVREIPKGMIIEIRELNPFDEDNPFAITDAAKESQFTLKTSGDYTRNALRNNINAPGILSTDVALEEEQFKNFVERVRNHKKGEPIFGNGGGAINWQAMQTELTKAALREVTDVNRDALFAVLGMSKTIMGIEQSGTTRETSRVQENLYVENHILPRIRLILDALNQDYKNNYPKEYEANRADIVVDNPNATDHDADLKDTDVKTKQFDLYTSLVNKGYKPELAAQYVEGKIDIEQLGKPTNKPITETPSDNDLKKKQLNDVNQGLIQQQEGSLQNAVMSVEEQLVTYAINRLKKGKVVNQLEETDWGTLFDTEGNFITKGEKSDRISELTLILAAFYGIIFNLQGAQAMNDRIGELGKLGTFTLDKEVRNYIKEISKKVAESHIATISTEIYNTAKEAALRGLSQDQIINELTNKYAEMSEGRAKVVARTETNRAFTRAQYEADRQFIEQNKLEGQVYKVWRTRSANPCPFCESLEGETAIPFFDSFRGLGSSIDAKGKSLEVNFEPLQAGNAHPNCSCTYELIIK